MQDFLVFPRCLSSLTLLQDLDVRETEINDEGLRVIASIPAIHTLHLQGCPSVSAGAVASLSIPNVLADDEEVGVEDDEENDEY